MPLVLDDIDLNTADESTGDPKFFSSKLTGNGRTRAGLLSKELLPGTDTEDEAFLAAADRRIEAKTNEKQNGVVTATIPFSPILSRALQTTEGSFTVAVPETRCAIETASSDWDIFFAMTPQGAKLFEDEKTGPNKMPRRFIVQYRMEMLFVPAGTEAPERAVLAQDPARVLGGEPFVLVDWSTDPIESAADFIAERLKPLGLEHTDPDALASWLREDYSVHDAIAAQAKLWTSGAVGDEVSAYIEGMAEQPSSEALNTLAIQLRYLETYNVPLEAYLAIHRTIESTFEAEVAQTLSKQNVNLLMSHTIHGLDLERDQLNTPAQPAAPVQLPAHLSQQQRDAITTHDPLVMDVAGAGTGKSTVILHRIKYLEACGVPASDITVLSFTNAAADNITAKNPDVGSMTIARMINDIYMLNHPSHELSSIDTIINSIDIFYPRDDFAARFRQHLLEVAKNSTGATTAMNTFIERHYDEVMAILDRIKQTSLELEIIICYQKIDSMVEPAHVQCKYLVIDEVQDNSIFEFIYVLKYVSKHKLSLYIVGDASQTLYEFRSANPRALNTLEGSGVFTVFKLTTNYRSNQEILDFANVVLGRLETNQISNIRLQANSLETPTAKSFQEKVTFEHKKLAKISEFVPEYLGSIIAGHISDDYVDARLAEGQKVAFLAYSRREVAEIEQALAMRYPGRKIANLVSEKVFATDVFSKYIKFFWNDVLQVQPDNASFVVTQGIKDNMEKLTPNAGNKKVEKAVLIMVSKWWTENASAIRAWEKECMAGSLAPRDFFERLRDNLLSFEIQHNAIRQSLVNQKNQERKAANAASDADLIVSTIHGVKGMEFDNVVVVRKESPDMGEDVKRLFYVAFTRAMKTMHVLAYGTKENPAIQSDYERIIHVLTEAEKVADARNGGVDPDLVQDQDDQVQQEQASALAHAS